MKLKEYIKKWSTYLMLVAYVFGILKPFSPIIKDVIAHTMDKAHHMATVHYENGKYHVHKELATEVDNKKNTKKSTENNSTEEILSNHCINGHYKLIAYYKPEAIIHTKINGGLKNFTLKSFTPPPEA